MENQRDLLRGAWRWYLLPFAPATIAMRISFGIRDGLWLTLNARRTLRVTGSFLRCSA